ncbi:DNA polymerase III subunit beta [Ligilactobacillus pabuli]|uniref:Beta sliding clamp n=1 Tax=Ligilactobacillus pabuli TaxID=2886039 RepID=A0ABQ5JJV8_9LACO|nr:DNA polymerase III subunit beta [Ligilactobacillus pabuli]GKS82183.1 DNA polymerase III subunit beta [Ligilactobacillus pabuli]HIW88986.1 DNA polymerase III subunit beta [Candidatus Ligilactobacillus excrementipullorum]
MKFSIRRSAFIAALNDAQRAISSKTAIDILTGIKIEVSASKLTLTGSDADISIETVISQEDEKAALEIEEPGSVVLPARFFNEIVKKLPEDTMTIAIDARFQATITSGQAEFTINGIDAETYPHLPEIEAENKLVIAADILKRIINQTVIAVSTQESRPILTGIHLAYSNGELLAVATDSHRLSQRRITLNDASSQDYDIIVPGKSLNELAKMLGDSAENVEIRIAENQILFTFANTSFYSRLLEGNYPDTDRLIPQNSETTIEFNAVELLHSIERASLLSHAGRSNVVKLTLKTSEQQAIISGTSPEIGNVEEDLSFKQLEGNDLEISFNPDYMKDALASFGQTDVKMSLTLPLRPFILVPTEDGTNFVQLITPVRTF